MAASNPEFITYPRDDMFASTNRELSSTRDGMTVISDQKFF